MPYEMSSYRPQVGIYINILGIANQYPDQCECVTSLKKISLRYEPEACSEFATF